MDTFKKTSNVALSIVRARNATGLNIAQLAASAEISAKHLWALENGKSQASIATLEKLVSALGLDDVSQLLALGRETHILPKQYAALHDSNAKLIELIIAARSAIETRQKNAIERNVS
jgi:transcriptional regulator with XRE-family HTH domain